MASTSGCSGCSPTGKPGRCRGIAIVATRARCPPLGECATEPGRGNRPDDQVEGVGESGEADQPGEPDDAWHGDRAATAPAQLPEHPVGYSVRPDPREPAHAGVVLPRPHPQCPGVEL